MSKRSKDLLEKLSKKLPDDNVILARVNEAMPGLGTSKISNKELKAYLGRATHEVLAEITAISPELRSRRICRKRSVGKHGDFLFFMRHYFPHYFDLKFGEQQLELSRDIQSMRGKEGRESKKLLRALSRGFGKSTIMSLCGVLWLSLTGTWRFVVMISATLTQAKDFLQKIIDEVESNEDLVDDFPELKPAIDNKSQLVSWRDSDIVFRSGFRIIARGFLNAVRGMRYRQHRPDALIVDDPDQESDVESESTMRRKYRWFDRAALRLGKSWGVDILFAYTNIAPNCVGEVVFSDTNKYRGWSRKRFRAMETAQDGKEYSTWEAGAPLDLLLSERDSDPVTFARERQNENLAESDQKFKGLIQVYEYPPTENWYNWRMAVAVDLSLGKTESSDYSAIIGVALAPEGKFYVVYEDIQRRRPDQIEEDLLVALQMFPWEKYGIEASGNQEYFILGFQKRLEAFNRLRPAEEAKLILPCEEIYSDRDKIRRVTGGLQPLIASGLLKLRSDSKMLFRQLEEFPYDFKDGPDALEMAVRMLRLPRDILTMGPDKPRMTFLKDGEDGKTVDQVKAAHKRRYGY